MKSSSQHKTFCSVLHSAVLDLCREKYYTETIDWEVDGILCISLPDSKEQHVVKIHEKFPLDRTHNLPFDDGRCFACEKQCDVEEDRERRDNDYQHNSEEEERYRDVSVIDLEHGIQPHNMVRTSPRGQQMEHISGRGEDLEGENQTAFFSQSKRQENSNSTISSVPRIEKVISVKESFSNIPNEPLPPPPVDIGDEADYTVIKTEPDESEDFGLHMQCVNEEYNPNKTSDVRDEAQQMQTEVKTEEVAFLLGSNVHSATSQNFDSSNTSSQAWGTRKHSLPSSTATISSINQPYPTASSSYDHSVKVSGNTMTLVKTPKMAAQNNVNNTSLSVPSTAAGNQSSTQQFKPLELTSEQTHIHGNREQQNFNYSMITLWCKHCYQRFPSTQWKELQRHEVKCRKSSLNTSPRKSNLMSPSGRKFICLHPNCMREYSTKQGLDDHIKACHTDKVILCKYCGKAFKWRTSLIRHKSKECRGVKAALARNSKVSSHTTDVDGPRRLNDSPQESSMPVNLMN